MQRIRYCLSSALYSEEILSFSPESDNQVISLIRILGKRKRLGHEDFRDLKESAVEAAVLLVAHDCMEHGSRQRGAHQGQLFINRIQDPDCLSLRCILRKPQQIQIRG